MIYKQFHSRKEGTPKPSQRIRANHIERNDIYNERIEAEPSTLLDTLLEVLSSSHQDQGLELLLVHNRGSVLTQP